jgi:xylan 1,4-beta-xylosidase
MQKFIITAMLIILTVTVYGQAERDIIQLADPSIFSDNGIYYLYGTGDPNGFAVYTSTDMKIWHRHTRNALTKGDSYGTTGFWAPQVFKYHKKYYMVYTANEQIAVAKSNSPLGPFVQSQPKPINLSGKHIDPFIFKDKNGDLYLYFVRLRAGNRIFAARLKKDLSDIDSTTVTECISAGQEWENTANSRWPVAEGPTVTKIDNLYYLFYSANDFRNTDYAVGYATSASPFGPFTKSDQNPILSKRNTQQNGSGHGDLLVLKDGTIYYVLHTHNSLGRVSPRKTAIIQLTITGENPKKIGVVTNTFHYLKDETVRAN